jgi:membrane protein YqaA with SNARE-associated domain
MKPVIHFIQKLERHVKKPWYPVLVSLLAGADLFVFVIPTDALLITSVMAAPRRWITLAAFTTVGFTLGCLAFLLLIHAYGLPLVEHWFPGIEARPIWLDSQRWMDEYGLLAIFVVSLLPIALHPILAVAVLADVKVLPITLVLLGGRVLKYGLYAWIASHSPKLLAKFKFERKEIEEILEPGKQDEP